MRLFGGVSDDFWSFGGQEWCSWAGGALGLEGVGGTSLPMNPIPKPKMTKIRMKYLEKSLNCDFGK